MKFLVPKPLTDAMLTSSTVAAPDVAVDGAAWVSGDPYALGDFCCRPTTRRVYQCALAHTGVTTPPEDDPTRWTDVRPMNRWAMFDSYISTRTQGPSPLTVVLRPGFINAAVVYGAVGSQATLTYKDGPGGTVLRTLTRSLYEPSTGWWDYLFGTRRARSKLVMRDLPIRPDPELTLTIEGTGTVGCGLLGFGDLRPLSTVANFGTQLGARAEPITYSYIKTEADGTVKIVRKGSATNLRMSVMLADVDGDAALAAIQSVLDVPVAVIGSDADRFDGLNGFGLISASLGYDSKKHRVMNVDLKGFI